ncbi:TetR family transcriptional regulator [Aureimonas endophytica]|uniref:TetR family transcriptional regulator n=1 Tax=Aureimonas endophytica TaxID=2027858 RepID=A0A916ZPK0_9HYPH|nr:TetR/AcrR family transcriptional regulator [Aureimonas endophytica]GGE05804.1 TetR family transcriptional regulator [Aureimonas endophytica]
MTSISDEGGPTPRHRKGRASSAAPSKVRSKTALRIRTRRGEATGPAAGRPRDPQRTRDRILEAATAEFAAKGLAGARVDEIAARATVNKRMLYHYFGNKDALFQAVVENAYLRVWAAEAALELDDLPPEEALSRLVAFTWTYYLAHPEFITLLNSENLFEARHFKRSALIEAGARRSKTLVERILERGVAAGRFRAGIDPVQLNITISAVNYYYLTNRHTGSVVYERDMASPEALAQRLAFNQDSILAMVRA